MLDAKEDGTEQDGHGRLILLQPDALDVAGGARAPARIVEETVETSKMSHGVSDHGLDLGLLRDVGADEGRRTSKGFRKTLTLLEVPPRNHHLGALFGKTLRRMPPDAAGATSDDAYLAVEPSYVGPLSLAVS